MNKAEFISKLNEHKEAMILCGDDISVDLCKAMLLLAEDMPEESPVFEKAYITWSGY